MTHLYVFAAVAGEPSPQAVSSLPAMPEGGTPRMLSLGGGVSLVVSDVSSTTYNAAALESRLADLDWVARCGAAHHGVAETLAEAHAVLPFRLFTLFSSEAKALTTLRKARTRIEAALARVTGRQEWILRIGRPDPARIEAAQSATPSETPRGAPREAAVQRASSGTSFLRAKADARREEVDRTARVASDAAALFDTLRGIADDAAARPAEPANTWLLDAAFLVRAAETGAFQQALSEAAAGLLRDGCPVSLTGPWPPYSFASLD